jgi:hypothetical protein
MRLSIRNQNTKTPLSSKPIVEWACRILFSVNLLLIGINYDDRLNYPMDALVFILLALWLYFYKLKIISIIPLLLALFLNYLHWGVTPSN